MKKIFLIILFLIYSSHYLVAQSSNSNKGTGKVYGTLVDATTNLPVQYATVALTDVTKNKLIDGTISDEKGEFEIINIPSGTYKITVNFISYKNAEFGPFEITELANSIYAGKIAMASDTKLLSEVVVEGQKALIEEKVDRIVYNAENDATSKGGDATDVLKRVPLLSVDLDGNVSLRGNQSIKLLINNRPSTLSAGSLADALKQIPADLIKSVEVITAPSSKYDAEGSGGIININLKKNSLEGVFLNVDASAGLRGSNLGLNGNLNKKKFRFSLGGFGRSGYNIPGEYSNKQITKSSSGQETTNLQDAKTRNEYIFGRYTFGMDYDINEHNFISTSVQYGLRSNWTYQDGLLTKLYQNDILLSQNKRNVGTTDLSGTVDVNLNYTHTFTKPQHEFSFLSLFSQNNRQNDFKNSILDTINYSSITNQLKNVNNSTNREITFQADYTNPITKNQIVEVGAKNISRTVSSDYQYLFSKGNTGNFVTSPNGNLSNTFTYNQNVTAAYLSYTATFLKYYSLKAGGRYEYTTIDANFKLPETNGKTSIPSYSILVPSINLSRKLKSGGMLKASFTRRIQRPSIQYLNPNIQNSNPLSATIGNPLLSPEYTNNYELSYSTNIKKTYINVSGFMRNTTGSIQSVRKVTGDTIRTTYQNIGSENAYGVNIFATVNISNKFSLNGGPDMFYTILDNNVGDPLLKAHNEGFVISGRIFGNYSLPKNWGLQMFAFYRGNQVQLQGHQTGFGIYSLSIKKDFNEKKGSIGFGAENFFTPSITVHNTLNSPVINQTSTNVSHNLSFKVNFSYKIGKINSDTRQRKSLQNDDLKDGGGDGGGGMMQGGQGGGGQGMPGGGQGGRPQGSPPGFKPGNGSTLSGFNLDNLPPGFNPANLPPGFDPTKMPPGFDPANLPPGFDPSKMPKNFDPSKLPPGFRPEKTDSIPNKNRDLKRKP